MSISDLRKRYVAAILKSAFVVWLVPREKQQAYYTHLQCAFEVFPKFQVAVYYTFCASPSGVPADDTPPAALINTILNEALTQAEDYEMSRLLAMMDCVGGVESRREMALLHKDNKQCTIT